MQVYIGIDWSEQKHAVVWMNAAGAILAQQEIAHSLPGFVQLDETRRKLGLSPETCFVGLETAHNLLIDYLWSQHYRQVYVVPPSVVKSNQGRLGSSGSLNDPKAAQLIADILRTDRGQLQPWQPDSLLTRQLRAKVSLILHLTRQATRLSNRLRAVLLRYYPAALRVFKGGLGSQITLDWIRAYPHPHTAAHLSYAELEAFTQARGYPQSQVAACWVRLHWESPQADPETVQVYQSEAQLLAQLLSDTRRCELSERRSLQRLFEQHPAYATFSSLPGTGPFLAPALCAKFGDDPRRFPQAASAQALAGTCPVTRQSGKVRQVRFRHGCDREWRHIAQLWAKALITRNASPIAVAYFQQIRPRCHSTSHAYRCLANRWLAVAWKLWSHQETYCLDKHFQHLAQRRRPKQ